jgi:hypothetical protein
VRTYAGAFSAHPHRHVFGCLAGGTAVLALAVGFLMTIIDFVSANQQELTGKNEERHAPGEEETRASFASSGSR